MKSKIKFGIIGCSSIAKKSTIPAIITNKNSIVEMIGSRSITKAEKFAKELEPYHTSKGAVQFPLDQPLPYDLMVKIALFRKKENVEKIKHKAKR